MLTLLAMLQGLSGPAIDLNDPIIGLLFSLVAASAHIIVPAAVFNLKVSFSFRPKVTRTSDALGAVGLPTDIHNPPLGCCSP